jgi:hypothetical protein
LSILSLHKKTDQRHFYHVIYNILINKTRVMFSSMCHYKLSKQFRYCINDGLAY